MPTQPLFDLARIDIERPIVDHASIYSLLRQSGSFALLDGILFEDAEEKIVVGYKDIRQDDWWAPDHIPGRPLFPGALMIESAAQLAAYDYMKHRFTAPEGSFVGFGGVNKTRFRGLVEPPSRMVLVVYAARTRARMFRYESQGYVDGILVFEAEITGVVV